MSGALLDLAGAVMIAGRRGPSSLAGVDDFPGGVLGWIPPPFYRGGL
jgi:hypothetical protein